MKAKFRRMSLGCACQKNFNTPEFAQIDLNFALSLETELKIRIEFMESSAGLLSDLEINEMCSIDD
jgi:hypothetical protein